MKIELKKKGVFILQLAVLFSLIFYKPLYSQKKDAISDLSIKKSIVFLEITPRHYNYRKPWLIENRDSFHSLALVMPNNKILALAEDVANTALIEVSKHSSYEKSIAKLDRIDYASNLALLSLKREGKISEIRQKAKEDFFKDLRPLKLGKEIRLGKKAMGVRTDLLFHVYRESFTLQDVNFSYRSGFTGVPFYSFKSQNNFPLGGLLLCKKTLCGFISYSNKQGEGEAILPSIIRAFLANWKKDKKISTPFYSGFVSQGFRLKNLVDPVKRSYLGLSEKNRGAMVSRVLPGTSAWGILKKKDIILKIDGFPIDSLGFYEDPYWGRQNVHFLLSMKKLKVRKPKTKVKFSILRDGKKQLVLMPLKVYAGRGERIPLRIKGSPPYCIENGIIFLELSVPLLNSFYGTNWARKATYASYLYKKKRYYKKAITNKADSNRIVVVGDVFPDIVTRSMQNFTGAIVKKLNDKKIINLASFCSTIAKASDNGDITAKLDLGTGRLIYLDIKNRTEIKQRIYKKYSIPYKFKTVILKKKN